MYTGELNLYFKIYPFFIPVIPHARHCSAYFGIVLEIKLVYISNSNAVVLRRLVGTIQMTSVVVVVVVGEEGLLKSCIIFKEVSNALL